MPQETCPTCGSAVSVHSGSEGTNSYDRRNLEGSYVKGRLFVKLREGARADDIADTIDIEVDAHLDVDAEGKPVGLTVFGIPGKWHTLD